MQPEQKTFLVNKLSRAGMDLDEIDPRVSSMTREVEKLQELRQAYMDNPALGDLDTVVEVTRLLPCIDTIRLMKRSSHRTCLKRYERRSPWKRKETR